MTLRRRIFIVVACIWMIVIFSFSAQTADVSGKGSLTIGKIICRIFVENYQEKSEEEKELLAEKIQFPIRKAAHMTEYAVLAGLFLGVFAKAEVEKKSIAEALLVTTCYAASDEFHQLFVDGRAGQITDVMIDACGAFLGICVILLAIKIRNTKRSHQ